jgi:hypothetical protein
LNYEYLVFKLDLKVHIRTTITCILSYPSLVSFHIANQFSVINSADYKFGMFTIFLSGALSKCWHDKCKIANDLGWHLQYVSCLDAIDKSPCCKGFQMESGNSKELVTPKRDVSLHDERAQIFIEYDKSMTPLHCLVEAIEMAGANIFEIITLSEEPKGKKSIAIKLDIQDVRNVILGVSKYPLTKIEGYNSRLNSKQNE